MGGRYSSFLTSPHSHHHACMRCLVSDFLVRARHLPLSISQSRCGLHSCIVCSRASRAEVGGTEHGRAKDLTPGTSVGDTDDSGTLERAGAGQAEHSSCRVYDSGARQVGLLVNARCRGLRVEARLWPEGGRFRARSIPRTRAAVDDDFVLRLSVNVCWAVRCAMRCARAQQHSLLSARHVSYVVALVLQPRQPRTLTRTGILRLRRRPCAQHGALPSAPRLPRSCACIQNKVIIHGSSGSPTRGA